jgi:hypothetical protein
MSTNNGCVKKKTYIWFQRYSLPVFLYTPKWLLQGEVEIVAETDSAYKVKLIYDFGRFDWIQKDNYNKLEEVNEC